MLNTVRISSKRQITIPARVYAQLGLAQGDTLSIEVKNNTFILGKSKLLLDKVAGSVTLPIEYKAKSLDQIISEAKKTYFQNKS